MSYVIHNIPADLEAQLRQQAERENKSVDEVAMELMQEGLAGRKSGIKKRDLKKFRGQGVADSVFEEIRGIHERIDEGTSR